MGPSECWGSQLYVADKLAYFENQYANNPRKVNKQQKYGEKVQINVNIQNNYYGNDELILREFQRLKVKSNTKEQDLGPCKLNIGPCKLNIEDSVYSAIKKGKVNLLNMESRGISTIIMTIQNNSPPIKTKVPAGSLSCSTQYYEWQGFIGVSEEDIPSFSYNKEKSAPKKQRYLIKQIKCKQSQPGINQNKVWQLTLKKQKVTGEEGFRKAQLQEFIEQIKRIEDD